MSPVERLRAAGCVYAEDEARVLREAAAGDDAAMERMLAEREAGRPLEQVVGWADLDGVRVPVAPGVFVPRARSALLVREAAARVRPGDVVVDLGCGTGALGLALLRRVPDLVLHATDADPAAVACARGSLPAGHVHRGDLLDALPADLRGSVTALLANLPYVPSGWVARMPREARDHEPRAALDGGPDGLDLHRRTIPAATTWLRPGGWLLTECGRDQAPTLATLMSSAGLEPELAHDADLDATVIVGRARGSS